MAIYPVEINEIIYVKADSKEDAQRVAEQCRRSILDNDGYHWFFDAQDPVTSINQVEGEWQDSLPYGEDEKTIRECLQIETAKK